jgi:hypothetical protein
MIGYIWRSTTDKEGRGHGLNIATFFDMEQRMQQEMKF